MLPACIERGITVVSNAGGLNPGGLAAAVGELARGQGLDVSVAAISGDDITARLAALRETGEQFVNLDTGEPLPEEAAVVTANAYLRARPIADALAAGAQVVVTGRITDAALAVGPALHAFGWDDGDLDAIAGAVVAGHVIECGAQCCGGNYAFFEEVPGRDRIGFPLAELHTDGSSVITKHPGTGGTVTVGTVTAQLLYEIAGPRYLSPDAVARFDTIELSQVGPDRVGIAGVRGEPPPPTLKVTANLDGGWRNAMTLALTGAGVAEKARFAADAVWAGIPGGRDAYAESAEELSGDLTGGGTAYLRLAVRGDDEQAVGRAFSGAVVETSLSSYPGTFFTSAPQGAQGVARYWPTTVAASATLPVLEIDGEAARCAAPTVAPGTAVGGEGAATGPARRVDSNPDGRAGASPARGARRGALGRQGRRRQHRSLGRRGGGLPLARRRLHDRSVPRPPARGRAVRRRSPPPAEPVGGQLRRPRHPRLGRGLEPAPGRAGEGPGRVAALAPRGSPGGPRGAGPAGPPRLRLTTGRSGFRSAHQGIWQDGPVEFARLVALVAGIAIVCLTIWSVFAVLVVPRVTSSRITRGLARSLGGGARLIAPRLPTYEVRDRVLSFVGPATMILIFGLWLFSLLLGFACIIWWDSGVDFASALGVSGSSVFTLGIATAHGAGPHTLEILAAGLGLLVIALEIAYLPALYNQFATPETEVTLLQAPAALQPGARRSSPGTSGSTPWTSSRRSTATGNAGPPPCRRVTPTIRRSSGSARRSRPAAGWWRWSP